jgi:hypothetical protein
MPAKATKKHSWAWMRYQLILAFIEEKLGLHKQFEDTVDRWKRKGLVKEVKLMPVRTFSREDVTHLRRETWDDVVEATRREPGDQRPYTASRSKPRRLPTRQERRREYRRLARLYRWQLRHPPKGPRETYDHLVSRPTTGKS